MAITTTYTDLTAKNLPGNGPRPSWLRVKLPYGESYTNVRQIIDNNKLHTVCESARCPNMGECWGAGTATFMILGNTCTRSCSFCAVATGRPDVMDGMEPERVAQAIKSMGIRHAVITSVNRDEQKDSGMNIWAQTVNLIHKHCPGVTMETLIPDVKARWDMLKLITAEKPDVISHNMETVKRLYKRVRPQARYERSLEQIQRTKAEGIRTKSGFMVGLGETVEEVYELMRDLKSHDCDVLTIGQYLQPTKMHLPVHEFVHPDLFAHYQKIGMEMGFDYVESGPLVRSSYHSERHL
ncbi:MAG: lipoyl synthase [Bacteroidia bacterium]